MNERDKELVKQAGLNIDGYGYPIWGCLNGADEKKKFLEKFAALIRADEREACAKVCDEHNARQSLSSEERYAAYWLAQAIRARKNK